MNKEELLKEIMRFPKVETINSTSAMNVINVDDLMSAVNRFDKVPDYNDLLKENQELKDNWEIIKQYCLDEQIPEESDEYNSYIEFSNSVYDNILNKMQELQGSDSDE